MRPLIWSASAPIGRSLLRHKRLQPPDNRRLPSGVYRTWLRPSSEKAATADHEELSHSGATMKSPIRTAVDFYERHPISAQIIIAKLKAERGSLDGLKPYELF